jgi:hypothetical protein
VCKLPKRPASLDCLNQGYVFQTDREGTQWEIVDLFDKFGGDGMGSPDCEIFDIVEGGYHQFKVSARFSGKNY